MAFSLDPRQARRAFLVTLGASMLALAGCQAGPRPAPGPTPAPGPGPGQGPLEAHHGVAVLVPLTGEDGPVGQSISNAANLALLDTGDKSIRLTVYNTAAAGGAAAAATKAIGDGNRLILGPLLAEDVRAATAVARRADVPLVAFSNDESVAGNGVFILGFTPDQSIDRVVRYARAKGSERFAALVPTGVYGQRSAQALLASTKRAKARVTAMETFNRSPAAVKGAVARLNAKGAYDALLIADSGRIAAVAAPLVKVGPRILGTELWASDKNLGTTSRLRGAWYATAPDARFDQLVARYRVRYGKTPYRIASLGYDAVLLAVRSSRNWPVGQPFPTRTLYDKDGFAGVDGIFRFGRDGVAERALEIRQVTASGTSVLDGAAKGFGD